MPSRPCPPSTTAARLLRKACANSFLLLPWLLVACRAPAPLPSPQTTVPSASVSLAEQPCLPPPPTDTAALPPAIPVEISNRVQLPAKELQTAQGESAAPQTADQEALVKVIRSLHQAWLNMDARAYSSYVLPQATRMPQQQGQLQTGREAIVAALPAEWEYFERSSSQLKLKLKLRNVKLAIAGDTATATYAIDVSSDGKVNWPFDDQWFVVQMFTKTAQGWRLLHEAQAADLNLDAGSSVSFADRFQFDYAYPVQDLQRAVAFYTPILGQPEQVTPERASFYLGGSRFYLEAVQSKSGLQEGSTTGSKNNSKSDLQRYTPVRPGLPNGYAMIYVEDLAKAVEGLKKRGVQFVTPIQEQGTDLQIVALDSSENILIFKQKHFLTTANVPSRPIQIASPGNLSPACVDRLRTTLAHWLTPNPTEFGQLLSPQAQWFDDSRSKTQVFQQGRAKITDWLKTHWQEFDRNDQTIDAQITIQNPSIRSLGSQQALLTFEMSRVGTGAHPFRETNLVTIQWQNPAQKDGETGSKTSGEPTNLITGMYLIKSNQTAALAKSLDYTGYPTTNLKTAEIFYSNTLKLGKPYYDEDYIGYWSVNSVFGVYENTTGRTGLPAGTRLPQPRQSNGYVSFWVSSAQKVYDYLKSKGAKFPIIPSINDRSGLDRQDGYVQLVTTDSEGNVILFTEYPAARKSNSR